MPNKFEGLPPEVRAMAGGLEMVERAMSLVRPVKPSNELLEALYEVRELIEGYVDVKDGDYGVPVPNNAMRAMRVIDAAIEKAEGRYER
jgi:hypothetical protein